MRISLRTQLLCVIAVIVVIAVAVTGVLLYSQLNSIMLEQIRGNLENVMNENRINMNETLNYIYHSEKILNSNKYFKSLLTAEYKNPIENSNRVKDMTNELKSTYGLITDENTGNYSVCFVVNSDLEVARSIAPFRGDGLWKKYNGIYMDSEIKDAVWYKEITENKFIQPVFTNDGYFYFTNVVRDVTPYDSSMLGIVVVGVDFSRTLGNITYMGVKDALHIAVVDKDGTIVLRRGDGINEENIAELISGKIENEKNMVIVNELEYGIKLVAMLDEKEINLRIKEVENYFFLCIALVIVAVFLSSTLISGSITKPIKLLSDTMKNVNENEDIQIKRKLPSAKEVVSLYQSYNKMMFRISQLLDEAKESGEREAALRMKMLQAQINPHFLYNALDSISMVAMMHEENEISEMISALSDSFRYSINEADNLIELSAEIEFINNYIKFQEWRYEEKISFETQISPEDMKVRIPKFIIQPIVENSIIHGMTEEENTLHIKITTEHNGSNVVISVTDNGAGCDVDELNNHISGKNNGETALKFGVKNVNERIKLKFGKEYGLCYYNTPGGGITGKITVPAESI